MENNRFKFRAWFTISYYDTKGNENEKQICFENVAVYGRYQIGISYYDAKDAIKNALDDDYKVRTALEYLEANNLCATEDWFVFDADVVEQYTGFDDMNGEPIYEGDIVGNGKFLELPIFWCHECCSFNFGYIDDKGKMSCLSCSGDVHWYEMNEFMEEGKLRIIGNIHENPELLEE